MTVLRGIVTVVVAAALAVLPACAGAGRSVTDANGVDETRGDDARGDDLPDVAGCGPETRGPGCGGDADAGRVADDRGHGDAHGNGDGPEPEGRGPDGKCGPETAADGCAPPADIEYVETEPGECELPPGLPPTVIQGIVYLDGDQSSETMYSQGYYPAHDSYVAGVPVHLLGKEGEVEGVTDTCGRFLFDGLEDGAYALDVDIPADADCTSANCPHRFPTAVASGEVVIVTIGDSLATHGGSPKFPDVLGTLIDPLVPTDSRNRAVPGSRSTDWLPGKPYFESKLAPELGDADVVVITLGGNDVWAWLGPAMSSPAGLMQKLATVDDFEAEIKANIDAIITEIWDREPKVDIVFCLMFDYSHSSYWEGMFGSYTGLLQAAAANAFEDAREALSDKPRLIVADMAGAAGDADVDEYLYDTVHLNAKGHEFYAREIFYALGGVIAGDEPLGLDRMVGFYLALP